MRLTWFLMSSTVCSQTPANRNTRIAGWCNNNCGLCAFDVTPAQLTKFNLHTITHIDLVARFDNLRI